ncbi:iron-containing alcohol dehydrogenase [Salmonella enterica]
MSVSRQVKPLRCRNFQYGFAHFSNNPESTGIFKQPVEGFNQQDIGGLDIDNRLKSDNIFFPQHFIETQGTPLTRYRNISDNRNNIEHIGCGLQPLAGPLGGLCDAPHGALCGTLLPYGLEMNIENVTSEERLSRLEEIRDVLARSFSVPSGQAFKALIDWSHRHGLGTLRELGVPYDALEVAAEAALNASSMRANPAKLNQSQLLSLLHKAW